MSLGPTGVRGPPPKSVAPAPQFPKDPVTMTLLLRSTAIPSANVIVVPPTRFAQRNVPLAAYFTPNVSHRPRLVTGPPPKSTVPRTLPATHTLPLLSTALPVATAAPDAVHPPNAPLQR